MELILNPSYTGAQGIRVLSVDLDTIIYSSKRVEQNLHTSSYCVDSSVLVI